MAIDPGNIAKAYGALVSNDPGRLSSVVASDAFIAVPANEGAGLDHLRALLDRVHRHRLRTWGDDSADVLVSDHHALVLDRWLAQAGGDELDQHVTVLFADRRDDGKFGLVSIYGYDSAAVERFFTE
jgi:hypothetical protein